MAEEKEFTVKDKRTFKGDEQEGSDPQKNETAEGKASEQNAGGGASEENQDYQLPEINFPTFIFSLNSSALLHMGVIEDPGTGQKNKNLPLAKQTIDILGMLEEKTKGNLTEDEAGMLKNFLYELRMLYVKEKG